MTRTVTCCLRIRLGGVRCVPPRLFAQRSSTSASAACCQIFLNPPVLGSGLGSKLRCPKFIPKWAFLRPVHGEFQNPQRFLQPAILCVLRSSETHAVVRALLRVCRDTSGASDHGSQGTEVAGATGARRRGNHGKDGVRGNRVPVCY